MLYLITATKNGGPFFEQMLASLKKPKPVYKYIHVIVSSEKITIPQNSETCTFISLHDNGGGLYAAINIGLSYIKKQRDFSCFSYINDDDGVLPGFWEIVAKHQAEKNDVTYGDVLYLDAKSEPCGYASICPYPGWLLSLFQLGVPGITQQGTIFSSRAIQGKREFNQKMRLAADSYFIVQLLKENMLFAYFDRPVAFYRKRPGQLSDDHKGMVSEAASVIGLAKTERKCFVRPRFILLLFRIISLKTVADRWKTSGFGRTRAFFDRK